MAYNNKTDKVFAVGEIKSLIENIGYGMIIIGFMIILIISWSVGIITSLIMKSNIISMFIATLFIEPFIYAMQVRFTGLIYIRGVNMGKII